eukprot:m.49900 g.49900  ORF g.49900 m.49900 type:complete len:705 (-) comp21159_c1_seq1:362-2476(-)
MVYHLCLLGLGVVMLVATCIAIPTSEVHHDRIADPEMDIAGMTYDETIAAAHAAAETNRRKLLDAWQWVDPSDQPDQVQGPALPTAQVILFNNNNATAVAAANEFLEACFANTSSDWWRMTFSGSWAGPPLENAYSVAVFTMFNSRSRWVQAGLVAPMSSRAETGMLAFWLKYVESCALFRPGESQGPPLRLFDSENIDTVRHTACYFGAASLSLFPAYANHTLSDNTTVYETAGAWENFTYTWLKAKALHGLFTELGSSGYWYRTWPCLFALHDLSLPGSRVQQRTKMFVDLAMMEAELVSIAGVRAGQKSRDKKAQCPTCTSKGSNPEFGHHMYTALTPQLYGDAMDAPSLLYVAPISTQQVGTYAMANVSILIHRFGAAPATNGVFTLRNRLLGQIDSSHTQTCSKERCSETLRPYPCACPGPGSGYTPLLPAPKQVHVVHQTPFYALAGVVFSPNDAYIPNCQQRGTGLVFSNKDHSAVSFPHLTGEKWALIDEDIMLVQRCGSCNYGGPSLFQVYNATTVWQSGEWWFMEAGNTSDCRTPGDEGTSAALGWAAMRPAWGGANFTNTTGKGATLTAGNVNPVDTWAPLMLVVGTQMAYGTIDNFTQYITSAKLDVNANQTHVDFVWREKTFGFTPGPSTWKGLWALPTIDAHPIDIDPPYMYASPHLNAALDSDVVIANYNNYTLSYNFTDDTIIRHEYL